MVITDLAQFELLVQEVRDQILSESQGVGEVNIVDNLDNIYSLPALKLNDSGDQVVEAPLSLLSAPAEEAAATANAAAQAANTAAESANNAAQSATQAVEGIEGVIEDATLAAQKAETSAEKANTAADTANQAALKADDATTQVLSGESERVEAENARQAAETERQSAEEERKSAEESRKLAEQSREEAEASRVSAEESRVIAESERVTAESSRAQAETERVLKESERESAELTRQENENTRVQLEQTRLTNEEQRVSAESSRETEYADLKLRADALIDDNEAAIENANTAAENANAAIANMENTYAKKDEIPDVSEFVTTTVDNLVNYYKKSETYTKEEINGLIGSTSSINFKVVDSLPETGESNIIYLVPSSKQEEKNTKDEYIWINENWELIGSTKIDLSNYYTKDLANTTFALKTELAWDTITGKPVWIGSSKPTYAWSEINKKPTTISGYGITDAYTKTESDERYFRYLNPKTTDGAETNWQKLGTTLYTNAYPDGVIHKIYSYGIVASFCQGTNAAFELYATDLSSSSSSVNNGIQFRTGFGDSKRSWRMLLDEVNYASYIDGRYVKKSGDTITGSLTVPSLVVSGSTATVSGNKIWHAGNDGSGSGLDADLLDGYHASSMLKRFDINITRGETINVEDYIKSNSDTQKSGNIFSVDFWSWDYSAYIRLDENTTLETMRYSIISYRNGNINESWQQQDLLFLPTYGSENMIYLAQMCSNRTSRDLEKSIKRYADYDTILASNVASATKLQTPRFIWGQSFDGTENVEGAIRINGSISAGIKVDLTFHPTFKLTNISTGGFGLYGWLTNNGYSHLQAGYEDNNKYFPICFNELGGNVGFGTTSPKYKVDVTGDIRATGNIIGTVSSDIQLKTILNTIDYQDKLLSLGDVVDYEYNEIAFDRLNSSTLLHRTYTGLIYLNVKDILPSMAYEDLDGYGCLNYLSYDYINLIAGALQQTITKLKQLEKRISILEEENISLRLQLSN